MTILKLSDENATLQKDIDRMERQALETRRTIRALEKQLRTPKKKVEVPTKNQLTQTSEEVLLAIHASTGGGWTGSYICRNFSLKLCLKGM